MITRTPSRRAETAAADFVNEDDGGYMDDPFSPISNTSSRASLTEHLSTATTDTVKYVVRYSTAVLHHLVSESVWLNMKNLPLKILNKNKTKYLTQK